MDYDDAPAEAPGSKPGKGWEWVQENGDDAIDVLNSTLCLINPRRPGCPGDPAMQPVIVNKSVPPWLILALALVFLIIVLLIFKRTGS